MARAMYSAVVKWPGAMGRNFIRTRARAAVAPSVAMTWSFAGLAGWKPFATLWVALGKSALPVGAMGAGSRGARRDALKPAPTMDDGREGLRRVGARWPGRCIRRW